MTKPQAVTVYCGSRTGNNPAYETAAEELGHQLAKAGVRLVYGGGSIGLMGVVARAVHASGGQVTGVIPEALAQLEIKYDDADELIVTENMHQRRWEMYHRADAFVVLPGGVGTLEEAIEILSWAYLKLHTKPMILLDIEQFWAPFNSLLDHCCKEGFVSKSFLEGPASTALTTCDKVSEVLPLIEQALTYRDLSS